MQTGYFCTAAGVERMQHTECAGVEGGRRACGLDAVLGAVVWGLRGFEGDGATGLLRVVLGSGCRGLGCRWSGQGGLCGDLASPVYQGASTPGLADWETVHAGAGVHSPFEWVL